ncbi:MAG: HNH endonuclease [Gammaproteobacteria bacterium]
MCPRIAHRDGYCSAHWTARTLAYNRARGSSTQQGYGGRWRKLRLLVLARDPICHACKRNPSSDADHILPRAKGGSDTLDNLQGLCHACHARKTALSDGRWGSG